MNLNYVKLNMPEYRGYIQRVQILIDKPTHTVGDFRDSGLIVSVELYEKSTGKKLPKECTEVIWYALGNKVVQHLETGVYFSESMESKDLKEVEEFLYNKL